jgi:hypothetical protein
MDKRILDKFTKTADYLTDEELKICLAYYKQIYKSLSVCPAGYWLVLNDVRSKLERLQGWDKARKEK